MLLVFATIIAVVAFTLYAGAQWACDPSAPGGPAAQGCSP
jgi:hypothetical protein